MLYNRKIYSCNNKTVVIEKLRSLGAEVTVHGKNWNSADGLARQWVDEAKENGGSAVYGEILIAYLDIYIVRMIHVYRYTSHAYVHSLMMK